MSAVIVNVRNLEGIDAAGRQVRDAKGTVCLDARRHPAVVRLRLRWKVAGETSYRTQLFDPRHTTAARRAAETLLRAWRNHTPVDADGWPVGAQRPLRRAANGTEAALAGRGSGGRDRVIVPAGVDRRAASMSVAEFFEAYVVPNLRHSSQANHIGSTRSQVRFLDRFLTDTYGKGQPVPICRVATEMLAGALEARRTTKYRPGDGGAERALVGRSTMRKFELVVNALFRLADTMVPPAILANPWAALRDAQGGVTRRHAKKPNFLAPGSPADLRDHNVPRYRLARNNTDLIGLLDAVLPHLPEHHRDNLLVLAFSGMRPSNSAALEVTDVDFDVMVLHVGRSLTHQSARDNGGVRLVETTSKEMRADDPPRRVPIVDHPPFVEALRRLIASAPTRAAVREADLVTSRVRPRSEHADPDAWYETEVAFARRQKLITTPRGAPLDPSNLDGAWRAALAAAFPDEHDPRRALRVYDLRSLYENWLIDAGVEQAVAAQIAGHSLRVQQEHYREQKPETVEAARRRLNAVLAVPPTGGNGAPAENGTVAASGEAVAEMAGVIDLAAARNARRAG